MDVSALVSTWLNSPTLKRSSTLLPRHQPISPRPDRLGLGADPHVNAVPKYGYVGGTGLLLNGRRKLPLKESEGVSPRQPLTHERDTSSEDDECSRATAIAATKQPASLTTELTRSRKRRRRKKQRNVNDRNVASLLTMNGGGGTDSFSQPSIIPILSQGVEGTHKFSDLVTSGDHRHEHIATNVHVGCHTLIEKGDNERSDVIYPLNKQQSLRGGCPESVTLKGPKRRHVLRGGAATTYCDNKTTKRYLNTSPPCESNVHPDAVLSNSQSTNSSSTKRASTDVVKQWTSSKQLHDQSRIRTSPTCCVDHDDTLMSTHVGTMDPRLMDMSLHKVVTMETRKWRRRHRKRLSMKDSSSSQLVKRLYLRKV